MPTTVVLEGEKLIREAALSGGTLKAILIQKGFETKWESFAEYLVVLPEKLIKKISSLETPSKEIGFFSFHPPEAPERVLETAKTVTILDRIQDPGNLGTIIRSCDAFGIDAIFLLKGTCSRWNPKVLRAAMGSCFRLPIFERQDWKSLSNSLKTHGFSVFATSKSGKDIAEFRFPEKSAIVFGNEGKGIDKDTLADCADSLSIKIRPSAESLNVAVAVSIFLFERSRQENRFRNHDRSF